MRTFDAQALNRIINDPRVRPTIGGKGELDIAAILADDRNVALIDGENGAFFQWTAPFVFEGHSFFIDRGSKAILIGLRMLEEMFDEHRAVMIWGRTPLTNKAARWWNRRLGFNHAGYCDTTEGDAELFYLVRG